MNSKEARQKVGKLDLEINSLSKLLFVFMMAMSFAIVALDGLKTGWYMNFFRFVLLLSAIIPISLRVNLDLAKIFYCYGIQNDTDMPETIPRNSTIPEELGRIQYLLTDKTGTLTKNDMIFKKLAMEYAHFDLENIGELKSELRANCEVGVGPMSDITSTVDDQKQSLRKRRDQQFICRDFVTALALCHNVTPTYPDESDHSIVEYQASSPDEVALVKFADSMNMKLIERDQNYIKIQNAAGTLEEYDILANFPFSSETKRMGIVLRHKETKRVVFYLKGAEVVMLQKVKPGQRATVDEACENLAIEGLRTLVIS
jgi:phospholipid-translocating ATPase